MGDERVDEIKERILAVTSDLHEEQQRLSERQGEIKETLWRLDERLQTLGEEVDRLRESKVDMDYVDHEVEKVASQVERLKERAGVNGGTPARDHWLKLRSGQPLHLGVVIAVLLVGVITVMGSGLGRLLWEWLVDWVSS